MVALFLLVTVLCSLSPSVRCAISFFCPRNSACETCLSVDFQGLVQQVTDSANILGGKIAVGQAIEGYLTYDLTVNYTRNGVYADYSYSAAGEGMFIAVHGSANVYTFESINLDFNGKFIVEVGDNAGSPEVDFLSYVSYVNADLTGTISALSLSQIRWQLEGKTLNAITSGFALPTTAPILVNFYQLDGIGVPGFQLDITKGANSATIYGQMHNAFDTPSTICTESATTSLAATTAVSGIVGGVSTGVASGGSAATGSTQHKGGSSDKESEISASNTMISCFTTNAIIVLLLITSRFLAF